MAVIAVRQHAITWANVNSGLFRQMGSLGHNSWKNSLSSKTKSLDTLTKKVQQHFSLLNYEEHVFIGMVITSPNDMYTLLIWHNRYSIYAKLDTNANGKNIEPNFNM